MVDRALERGCLAQPSRSLRRDRNQDFFALLRKVRAVTSRAQREAREATKRGQPYDRALRELYEAWTADAEVSLKVVVLASAIEVGVMLQAHFFELVGSTTLDRTSRVLYLAVCRRARGLSMANRNSADARCDG